jgi:hypothetical protein
MSTATKTNGKAENRLASELGGKTETVTISPPRFKTVTFRIIGTAPYCQARFSAKAMAAMRAKQAAGSAAKKGTKRDARDFDADYEGAFHRAIEGWVGIPAAAFRNACIDACRMVGFKMTVGKMSVFVLADGTDKVDGAPLVKLIAGTPERTEMAARNATGVCDIRVRPLWREWAADVRIQFDEDQFSISDVTNLLARAGVQVGVGEGRPFSRESNGMGFGTFRIASGDE